MPFSPTLPDLDLFKVVPPSAKPVRLEDTRLPDGTPMIGPDGLLIPSARSFSMVVNAATRVHSYRFDEAMRDNFVNARAMRRDAFIRGLLEERILPTINREFSLEVDDDRDPEQQYVKDGLTKIIRACPQFSAMKRALLDAVWFGRAGAQWTYARNEEVDNLWGVHKWDPLHGDSVQFTFDGVPAVLMDTMTTGWYAGHGAKFGPPGAADLEPTDRGGTALVLRRPYWRDRFAIHQHILEKADYLEGELAGSVQGLGLRGLVYWQYVVRTDALTWMLAYMQAVGQMDLLVFNYPAGNFAAQQQQEVNAQRIIGKAAIACPRDPKGNWPAVEQIPMNSAGLTALQTLVADYFDRHIERLIVGQSMSAGADKGTGLGGTGRAEFTKATKDEILVYDTTRLDETLTVDLVRVLKKYNFPWAKFPVRFKSVMPDLEAQEKVMSGKVLISVGIPIKADELREAAGYSRPEPGDDVVGAPPQMGPPGAAPGGPPGAPPGAGGGPGQPPPPAWMGAPSGPPGGAPAGTPGPALLSRAAATLPYMGYPGGGNTHIPSFGGSDHPEAVQRRTRYGRAAVPVAYGEKLGCVYVNLESEAAFRVLQAAHAIHPDDLAPDGRELTAHVTVRHGFPADVSPQRVAGKIGRFGPVRLRLGRCAYFANDDHDVLYFVVESEDLRRLNRLLGKLPNTQTHGEYKPHATIGYVKKGHGAKYAARFAPLNLDFTTDTVVFSDPARTKTAVSLTGQYSRPIAIQSDNPEDVPIYPYRRPAAPAQYEQRPLEDLLEINAHLSQQVEALRNQTQYARPRTIAAPRARSPEPYADAWTGGFSTPDDERDPPLIPPPEPLAPNGPDRREAPVGIEPTDTPGADPVPVGAPQTVTGAPLSEPQTTYPAAPDAPAPAFERFELDHADPDAFAVSLGTAAGAHGETEPHQMERAHGAMAVARALPEAARTRLADGRMRALVSHRTLESCGAAWAALSGEPAESEFGQTAGFYNAETGEVHTNGHETTGTLAHEIGHALDRSRAGPGGYYALSATPEWKRAWRWELAAGALEDYAAVDEVEGFAEFARLLYAEKGGVETARTRFPRCFAVWAGFGLI